MAGSLGFRRGGSPDGAEIFRDRRDSRPGQREDHRRNRDEGRTGRGLGLSPRRTSPPGGDRQGHAPVELHDRICAGRRIYLGRRRRAAARAGSDPGGRDADALDALRSRGDDLGVAQPLRRQRHQAVRPRRIQAVGRGRDADRGAHGRRRSADARPVARSRPRQAHRRRPGPLHRIRQADAEPRRVVRRSAHRDRLRQRRRLQGSPRSAVGARRRGESGSASNRTGSTSISTSARPRPRR